jgi:hypothetical protein
MGEALVAVVVGEHDFAAPDGCVVAVAGAVEGDAEDGGAAVEAGKAVNLVGSLIGTLLLTEPG